MMTDVWTKENNHLFFSVSGGEAETGGTHTEREKDPASHQLPLFSQFRVSLQGEAIASGTEKDNLLDEKVKYATLAG